MDKIIVIGSSVAGIISAVAAVAAVVASFTIFDETKNLAKQSLAIQICDKLSTDSFLTSETKLYLTECGNIHDRSEDYMCKDGRFRSRIEGNIANYYDFIASLWYKDMIDKDIVKLCISSDVSLVDVIKDHEESYYPNFRRLANDPELIR